MVPILLLVGILAFVPLAGIACGSSEPEVALKASFTASKTSGVVPLAVTFTDTSEGDITGWEWDLNGDGTVDSTDQNPSRTYTDVGAYTIILKVTGPEGTDTAVMAQYVSATAIKYNKVVLSLNSEVPSTQTGSMAAQKFADLVKLYTGGAVTVDVYTGGTLFKAMEQFDAVKTGTIDIAWIHPYYLRSLDPNLDWVGALPNIFVNLAHARAVMEEGSLVKFTQDALTAKGLHLIGYFESIHMGGYFNTLRPTPTMADMKGMKMAQFRPGPLDPFSEYLGLTGQVVSFEEVLGSLASGIADCTTNSLDGVAAQGYIGTVKHALISVSYSAHTPVFNLAKWNSLQPELQDLITNKVIPETQAFSIEEITRQERASLVKLKAKGVTIGVISPAKFAAVYDTIKNYDSYKAILARTDPKIPAMILSKRPTNPTYDPEILEMLAAAGITATP